MAIGTAGPRFDYGERDSAWSMVCDQFAQQFDDMRQMAPPITTRSS